MTAADRHAQALTEARARLRFLAAGTVDDAPLRRSLRRATARDIATLERHAPVKFKRRHTDGWNERCPSDRVWPCPDAAPLLDEYASVCSTCNGSAAVPALGGEQPADVDNGYVACPDCTERERLVTVAASLGFRLTAAGLDRITSGGRA